MEKQCTVRLVNVKGLHARPCHAIVSATLEFKSDFRISSGDNKVNGRSILELMTLSAPCDAELTLHATGDDADALLECIADLIRNGFDEELS